MKYLVEKSLLVLLVSFSVPAFAQKGNKQNDSTRIAQSFGDDFIVKRQGENFVLHKKTPLTVGQFSVYQWYVRDSVTLEGFYEFVNNYSFLNPKKILKHNAEQKKYLKSNGSADYKEIRKHGTLNFGYLKNNRKRKNRELDYFMKSRAILEHPSWRFFRAMEYDYQDFRLYFREYFSDSSQYPIFTNHWVLAKSSKHPHDIVNIFAKLYPIQSKHKPVVGIGEEQIDGFKKFKARELSKCLNSKGLMYRASIEANIIHDTIHIEVNRTKLIKNWKIDLEDYRDFLSYVKDSTIREFLFFRILNDQKAEKFLRYKNYYLDVDFGEFVDRDPVERLVNREFFPLNYRTKISKKDIEIATLLELFKNDKKTQMLYFRYDAFDAKSPYMDTLKITRKKNDRFLVHDKKLNT